MSFKQSCMLLKGRNTVEVLGTESIFHSGYVHAVHSIDLQWDIFSWESTKAESHMDNTCAELSVDAAQGPRRTRKKPKYCIKIFIPRSVNTKILCIHVLCLSILVFVFLFSNYVCPKSVVAAHAYDVSITAMHSLYGLYQLKDSIRSDNILAAESFLCSYMYIFCTVLNEVIWLSNTNSPGARPIPPDNPRGWRTKW